MAIVLRESCVDGLLDRRVVGEDLGDAARLGVTGRAQRGDGRDDPGAVGVALGARVDLALERGLRRERGRQGAADQLAVGRVDDAARLVADDDVLDAPRQAAVADRLVEAVAGRRVDAVRVVVPGELRLERELRDDDRLLLRAVEGAVADARPHALRNRDAEHARLARG